MKNMDIPLNANNLPNSANKNCLICDVNCSSPTLKGYNISNLYLFEQPTCSIFDKLSDLLSKNLNNQKLHSNFICDICINKIMEFENLKNKLNSIKENFNKLYHETAKKHSIIKENYIYFYLEKSKENMNKSKRIITEEGLIVPYENISINVQYSCHLCEYQFENENNLNEHLKNHPKENLWKCDYCSKTYNNNKSLQFHLKLHSQNKSFHCEYCERNFNEKYYYKEHLLTHTGEKPFNCSKCLRKFLRKKDLKVHFKIHTEDKPFECTICKKTFAVKSRLKRHCNIHSGIKPFACEFCDKNFSQKYDLMVHRRLHTGEQPFQCSFCKKKFTAHSNYLAHVKNHRKKKTAPLSKSFPQKTLSQFIQEKSSKHFYLTNNFSLTSDTQVSPYIIVTEEISNDANINYDIPRSSSQIT